MQEPLWRLGRPADISWRDWDGLGAVHDDGSGNTHLVDALSIELLELLTQQPMSVRQLVNVLGDALPESMDEPTALAFFERQLESMQDLRLLEST